MTVAVADTRAYEANVPRFYAFSFLFLLQLLMPIWVIYLIDVRDLSLGQVTAMEGVFWVAMLFLEVPTGVIADRFGRATSLRLGAITNTVGMLVFAFSSSFPILFGSYMLLAVSFTLFSGADAAFFYDTLKALKREDEYQRLWGRCWALQSAGLGVSLVAGSLLAQLTSVHFAIIASGVLTAPLIVVAFMLKEPPRHEAGEVQVGIAHGAREAVRLVLRQPQLRTIMPLSALTVATAAISWMYIQPFFAEHDVPVGWWGAMLVPGQVLSIGGSLVAYRIVLRVGFPRMILVLTSLALVPLAFFAGIDAVWVFLVFPLAVAVEGTAQPVVTDYVNRRVPSAQRATVLSIYSFMLSLFIGIMVPLTGLLADSEGLRASYTLGLGIGAVGLPLLFLAWFRSHRKYGSRPPVLEHDLPHDAGVMSHHPPLPVHIEEPAGEPGSGSG
ncbi:MAG: MFS transporter [Dehalococcoidia bacterium]